MTEKIEPCSFHPGRGRKPEWCPDCRRVKQQKAELEANRQPKRIHSALTRAKGRKVVEDHYLKEEEKIRSERDSARDKVNNDYAEQIKEIEEWFQGQRLEYHKRMAPFEAKKNAGYTAAYDKYSAANAILQAERDKKLAVLEIRCHYETGAGKVCDRYVDIDGKCPVHGPVPEPGESWA